MEVRSRLALYGTVQGVGFRYHTRHHALVAGLCGYVWNRPDGAVELEVEGAADPVARFLEAVRQGPPGAQVDRVEELVPTDAALPSPFKVSRETPR